MTHTLGKNDGHPTWGLEVMNTYAMLKQGSKSVPVVIKNLTSQPITTKKGYSAGNITPEKVVRPETMEHIDDMLGVKKQPMTVDERRKKIVEQLDLKALEAWPNNLAEKA